MAGMGKNLKNMFSDSKVRTIFIFTFVLLLIGALIGYLEFRKRTQELPTQAALGSVPQIQSIPGGFETPETVEYTKLQEKQNVQQAQQAEKTGTSAIPTITSSQKYTNGQLPPGPIQGGQWQAGLGFSTLERVSETPFAPKQLDLGKTLQLASAGDQITPVLNDQGCVIGFKGKDQKVCDLNGNEVGTISPDGKVTLSKPVTGGLGRPIYDANGNLIGYAGQDGVVRDANGKTIGTLGTDGTVRDANGRVIGSTAPGGGVTLGKPVYDASGHLMGYAGPDGVVRDPNGKVIGTLGKDGVVRDASGQAIGSANPTGLGQPVYDANGRLLGYAGPDGVVRDANGKVLGTLGPDGALRDANGQLLGSTTPPTGAPQPSALGRPVYDANGRLLGYAGPDGVVRDANGKVLGTLGPDGTLRDASGQILGSTTPPAGAQQAGALGRPVYDANGHLLGYAGPDGVVRDANGKVLGTLGPDGTLRDASGKVLGSTTPPSGVQPSALGRPVYDPNGKLIGYADPDGTVRDATGQVLGKLDPTGVMHDALGRVIGNVAPTSATTPAVSGSPLGLGKPVYDANGRLIGYEGPNGIVTDPSGKVIGTMGPDGTVRDNYGIPIAGPGAGGAPSQPGAIPSVFGTTPQQANLQAIQQRQIAQMNAAQFEQAKTQLQASMTTQANQLINSWAAPSQVYVVGTTQQEQAKAGQAGGASAAGGAAGAGAAPLMKAGTIFFAVLETAINSDEPGPVMATLVSGPYKGGKLLGSLTNQGQKVLITFNLLNMPSASKTITINAVAIDPNTARTALSSYTDNHYLLRYGTMFASSFIQGYGQAFQTSGQQITTNGLQTNVAQPKLSPSGKFFSALGNVGQQWSSATSTYFNTPPTVYVNSGIGLGILFLTDVAAQT